MLVAANFIVSLVFVFVVIFIMSLQNREGEWDILFFDKYAAAIKDFVFSP